MQALMETIFDGAYLLFVIVVGLRMLWRGQGSLAKKFGWMTLILGVGDAFHLLPRCYALWTTGLEANAAALGIGKLITSITMTVFYLFLYAIWRQYYGIGGRKGLSVSMWGLFILRVIFCLLPQNQWLVYRQPLFFGVLRNIPFTIMGLIIIVIFAQEIAKSHDQALRFLPLAVALSFGFYLPVVLFGGVAPMIGMLMIPKTLVYAWIVWMGWQFYAPPTCSNISSTASMKAEGSSQMGE